MRSTVRWALPLVLATGMALPAAAQQGGLQGVLSGNTIPSAVKLRDLNSTDWRVLSIKGPAAAEEGGGGLAGLAGGLMGAMFGGNMPTMPKAPSYTKGVTVTLGGETFLAIYRVQEKPLDLPGLMKAGPGAKLPPVEKPTADSVLALTLVNVRSIESISGIRPFELQRELAEGAKRAEAEAAFRAEMEKGGPGGLGGALGGLGGLPAPDDITKVAPEPAPKKPAAAKPAPAKPKAAAPKAR